MNRRSAILSVVTAFFGWLALPFSLKGQIGIVNAINAAIKPPPPLRPKKYQLIYNGDTLLVASDSIKWDQTVVFDEHQQAIGERITITFDFELSPIAEQLRKLDALEAECHSQYEETKDVKYLKMRSDCIMHRMALLNLESPSP